LTDKQSDNELKEFKENPYSDTKKPEDIVRLFYSNDVPIIPVVSQRDILIGILRKEDIISELSDIERVGKLKIDKFVTKLARKFTFEELLVYGKIKEFVTINIFGELIGTWSRIKLFTAVENPILVSDKKNQPEQEIERQKEEQQLEWLIYLILEHIPRGLYALNEKGKTIFFNSYFDDIYTDKFGDDVDPEKVEKIFKSTVKNSLRKDENGEAFFYNSELEIFYEKVPLKDRKKKLGFLIFCHTPSNKKENSLSFSGLDVDGLSFKEILDVVERHIVVETFNIEGNLTTVAKKLQISKQALNNKIKKHNIDLP